MGVKLTGFDELIQKFSDSLGEYPEHVDTVLTQSAELMINDVKMKTPYITGVLRNGWHRTGVIDGKVEIYNNTEYANHVEYGHRTRNGGYVKGKKMLHRSIVGMRSQFARNARIILRNLTND